MDDTHEVPAKALLWLDRDVAAWLHAEAELRYGGDVGRAMNETIRAVIAVDTAPTDPWAGVKTRLRASQAAQQPGNV